MNGSVKIVMTVMFVRILMERICSLFQMVMVGRSQFMTVSSNENEVEKCFILFGGIDLIFVCLHIFSVTDATSAPSLLGVTPQISGIFDHSSWLSQDVRVIMQCHLFSFDQNWISIV